MQVLSITHAYVTHKLHSQTFNHPQPQPPKQTQLGCQKQFITPGIMPHINQNWRENKYGDM